MNVEIHITQVCIDRVSDRVVKVIHFSSFALNLRLQKQKVQLLSQQEAKASNLFGQ